MGLYLGGSWNKLSNKYSMIKKLLLSSNQFAVLMADGATGHVLTTNGILCLNVDGEVYVVFDDLETARLFIKHKQDKNEKLEFIIYNYKNEVVECWGAKKWKH